GGVLNTNSTLNFIMQSNLSLQVTFADVTRPTVAITNPVANTRLSDPLVTVRGTASDNALVRGVWYQLNGGAWNSPSSTNGWTNWMETVGLIKGTNVVRAYSVDANGNTSLTNSIGFVSSNAFTLHLGVSLAHSMTSGGPDLTLD